MSTIFTLMKICKEESHADSFLSGRMYMNRLSYFARIEDQDQRSDKHEGLSSWMQPDQIQLHFGGHLINGVIRPVSIKKKQNETCPILCLYAIHSGPYHSVTEENIIEFTSYLKVNDIVQSFGDYAILMTNVSEFLKRFMSTAQNIGFGFEANLVEYFSYDSHNTSFVKPGFHKLDKYSDQHEYRIRLDIGDDLETPFTFEIGDLSDIAIKFTTNDLLNNDLDIFLPNRAH